MKKKNKKFRSDNRVTNIEAGDIEELYAHEQQLNTISYFLLRVLDGFFFFKGRNFYLENVHLVIVFSIPSLLMESDPQQQAGSKALKENGKIHLLKYCEIEVDFTNDNLRQLFFFFIDSGVTTPSAFLLFLISFFIVYD